MTWRELNRFIGFFGLFIELKIDLELVIGISKITVETSLETAALVLSGLVFLNVVASIIVDNSCIVFNALLALSFISSLYSLNVSFVSL